MHRKKFHPPSFFGGLEGICPGDFNRGKDYRYDSGGNRRKQRPVVNYRRGCKVAVGVKDDTLPLGPERHPQEGRDWRQAPLPQE